ncbi:MAG: TniB family NTP-binding protein [Candidatus Binataceae bacterium]
MTAHLMPKAQAALTLPDDQRIEEIRRPHWISYSKAEQIEEKLEDLLKHPKQPRMPNMLLVGETNNGKTLLIEHFRSKHPRYENIEGEAIRIPVLSMQAPPGPDERGFYNAILERLGERMRGVESTDQKRARVIHVLKQISLGMIIIDEIHHLLAGPTLKQRNFLNVLKYLGNELRVPIVGVGTADALRAVQTDAQMQNRFVPEVLPKWELNTDFAKLLTSFESVLPLRRRSSLAERALAGRLLALSGGTIGELSLLLTQAALHAIRTGAEKIDSEVISSCTYVPPSERQSAAARA